MIAIIDYGMGNLRSVQKALEKVGAKAVVTQSAAAIRSAKGVVLPGVGAFGEAVRRLKQYRLMKPLQEALASGKPFLGICLGLQLLFENSQESPGVKGLGHFKGSVVRFKGPRYKALKVPHMGWNTVSVKTKTPYLKGIRAEDSFYFVHSFYPEPKDRSICATETPYGKSFCSAVAYGRLFASQFHPEKSGAKGLRILRNFVNEVTSCS